MLFTLDIASPTSTKLAVEATDELKRDLGSHREPVLKKGRDPMIPSPLMSMSIDVH
jgi:hypothetical protein